MVKAYRQKLTSFTPIIIALETKKEYDQITGLIGTVTPEQGKEIYKNYNSDIIYDIYCAIMDAYEENGDC